MAQQRFARPRTNTSLFPIASRIAGAAARKGVRRVPLPAIAFLIALSWPLGPAAVAQGLTAATPPVMSVRGVVRPSAQAAISSDLSNRIVDVAVREGAPFRKGEVLIAFDCRRQKAELASAEAQRREMQVALEGALHLQKLKAGNRQDAEIARARAERAAAEAEAIRARLDDCEIEAPFDGRVAELDAHEHETPAVGEQLLVIVATSDPRIELIVPSSWLAWLAPGREFQFRIDDTRKSYTGVVSRLGAAVDTVSQTINVFADFEAPTSDILPGMSGIARFASPEG